MPEKSIKDPGLQPERTLLAWRRTILSLIVTDFLIWRAWLTAASEGASNAQGLGVAACAASVATIILALCIFCRALQFRRAPVHAPPVLIKTAAGAVFALAAAVIASSILSRA